MVDDGGKASPWPVFVALGLVTAEVGVLFGLVPLAVGGVLVFGGSCAGMAREAGYAENTWRPLRLVGGVIGVAGATIWAGRAAALTPDALRTAAATDGVAVRAAIILGAGVLLIVAGYAGAGVTSRRPQD